MTSKWPSSCLHAVSSIQTSRNGTLRFAITYQASYVRRYAQPAKTSRPDIVTTKAIQAEYSAKVGFELIESRTSSDPVNPPRSTLPPPLELPERDTATNAAVYWFRVGRAYGTFYKEGLKAVWYNNKATRLLRERIKSELGAKNGEKAAAEALITRSDWQLLKRNDHDISKLPLFGVLVAIFGEWLPLLVPWIPGAVPSTCYIPTQVRGMREKVEERRRISFRSGNFEPSDYQALFKAGSEKEEHWPMTSGSYVKTVVLALREDQLHHISSSLGLHARLWDRLQLYPFGFIMRHNLGKHLQYLAIDDRLLLAAASDSELKTVELERACQERGLDVLGRPEAVLRDSLTWWLKRQDEDKGRGRAMLSMLFRRPNAWDSIK